MHGDLPLKRGNSWALDKHVLPTFVFKLGWLGHLQCEDVSRINSNLQIQNYKEEKTLKMKTFQQPKGPKVSGQYYAHLQKTDSIEARPEDSQSSFSSIE